jgi:hypothetical protein
MSGFLTQESIFLLGLLVGLAWAIVNIVFAIGVLRDALRLQEEHGRPTEIVSGAMWAFATLMGGVFVAAVYWLIHRSTLSNRT